jgi:hypothetical protein
MENTPQQAPARSPLGISNPVMIAVGVVVLVAGYKLMQTLGLIDTKEDKEESAKASSFNDLFAKITSPEWADKVFAKAKKLGAKTFWQISSITPTQATEISKTIWDAKGTFNDDEEKVYTAFRTTRTFADIWCIAINFKTLHKRNMVDFMDTFIGEEEKAKIFDIIKNYPDAKMPK